MACNSKMFILSLVLLMKCVTLLQSAMKQGSQQGSSKRRGCARDIVKAGAWRMRLVLTGLVLVLVAGMGYGLYLLIKKTDRGKGA